LKISPCSQVSSSTQASSRTATSENCKSERGETYTDIMVRRMESHLKNSPKADVDDMKFTNYYENGKLVESDN